MDWITWGHSLLWHQASRITLTVAKYKITSYPSNTAFILKRYYAIIYKSLQLTLKKQYGSNYGNILAMPWRFFWTCRIQLGILRKLFFVSAPPVRTYYLRGPCQTLLCISCLLNGPQMIPHSEYYSCGVVSAKNHNKTSKLAQTYLLSKISYTLWQCHAFLLIHHQHNIRKNVNYKRLHVTFSNKQP